MKISVLIPVFNEAQIIQQTILQFRMLPGDWEIIVADGGSKDQTLEAIEPFPEVQWVSNPGMRGALINLAAQKAHGEALLILHADAMLPIHAHQEIERIIQSHRAGAFRTWTVAQYSKSKVMQSLLHLADFRSRYSSLPYGDQGVFIRKNDFEKMGGYPVLPLMDDYEFSKRIKKNLGPFKVSTHSIHVSGRRMETSPLYYSLAINILPLLYRMGISSEKLSRLYPPER